MCYIKERLIDLEYTEMHTDTYVCSIIFRVVWLGLALLSYVFIELDHRPEQQGNYNNISIYANQVTYIH